MSLPQEQIHRQSLEDPESFWAQQAEHVYWHQKPTSVLKKSTKTLKSGIEHPYWSWFDGGKISTCYNCVDRHVLAGNGDCPAIFYDSPVTKTRETITYSQLLNEVETFAGILRDEGVKKGDVVLVYSKSEPRPIRMTGWLISQSAHDSRRVDRYPSYHPARGCSYSSIWWVCSECFSPTNCRCKACHHSHCFMRYRGDKAPYRLQTIHNRGH